MRPAVRCHGRGRQPQRRDEGTSQRQNPHQNRLMQGFWTSKLLNKAYHLMPSPMHDRGRLLLRRPSGHLCRPPRSSHHSSSRGVEQLLLDRGGCQRNAHKDMSVSRRDLQTHSRFTPVTTMLKGRSCCQYEPLLTAAVVAGGCLATMVAAPWCCCS